MFVLRPIQHNDLDPLIALVLGVTHGLTTLPKDRELLEERIHKSIQGFASKTRKPGGEFYFFVMENDETHELIGTCGIDSKVGGFEPFYAYRMEVESRESRVLKSRRETPALHLVRDHSGPSEIGSLFLASNHRGGGLGRFLSLTRFVFMAEFPQWFEDTVIAEMRGVVDEKGHSPFWEALGRYFFDMEYHEADYMSIKDKRFIGELMPSHPIYIPLLPKPAQDVIGQVHPETRPALKLLEEEGFRPNGMVDIFEAGPIIQVRSSEIRTVRQSRKAVIVNVTPNPITSEKVIVAKTSPEFRACLGSIENIEDGGVKIDVSLAASLRLEIGDEVRFSPLREIT